MNDVKQLFQDIKNVFQKEGVEVETELKAEETKEETNNETNEEVIEQKFEDVTLADGSIAQIEPDVSLGAAMVIQVEDELLPAPTGDYELADGRVVSVEEGVIVAVSDPELEEDEEVPAEEVVEEVLDKKESPLTANQRKEAKKIIESIITEKHFASEEETIKLNSELNTLRDAFNKLLEITEKLIEEPTTNAVKKSNSSYSKLKKESRKDIVDRIRERNIIN